MTSLTDILEEVYRLDYAEFDNPPKHLFSHRSRKRLKKIHYPKSVSCKADWRAVSPRKRIIIALMIIAFMTAGITAVAAANGFGRKEHRDNTEVFLTNVENSPKTIEYMYYLPEIPDGYSFNERISESTADITIYTCLETGRGMKIIQRVKENYKSYFDNEHALLEDIEVNGHKGLYLKSNYTDLASGIIIWDNMDYVLEISGDFDKNTLLEFARSLKIRN